MGHALSHTDDEICKSHMLVDFNHRTPVGPADDHIEPLQKALRIMLFFLEMNIVQLYITSLSLSSMARSISALSWGGRPGMSTFRKPRTMVEVASSSLRPLDMR